MRPVDKGLSLRIYTRYQDAQLDLIERLGDYCSYCERQIETNLAVEHIVPKSRVERLRNEWTNFLLGCGNCNSCKGSKRVTIKNYFWPDLDNTLLAFDYLSEGRVVPHPALSATNATKAQATITLFGLDRDPGQPKKKRPTAKDFRWLRRREAWDLAMRNLERLTKNDTPQMREAIVEVALGRGLFSIWMKVFESDPDMRCRLIRGFRGTAMTCFDAVGLAISRAGGEL